MNLALEPPSPRWSSVIRKFRGGASSAACSGLSMCRPFHHYIEGKVVFLCWIYCHGFGGKAGFLCCNSFHIRHNPAGQRGLDPAFPGLPLDRPQCPRCASASRIKELSRSSTGSGKGNTGIGLGNAAWPAGEVLFQLGIFLGVFFAEISFTVDKMPQQLVRLFPGKERCGLVGVSPEVDALCCRSLHSRFRRSKMYSCGPPMPYSSFRKSTASLTVGLCW